MFKWYKTWRLMSKLNSKNPKEMVEAAKAFAQLGDARGMDRLIKALKDGNEDDDVRASAARALGELGDARAVDPLISLLGYNVEKRVKGAAAKALRQFRAVGPLIKALYNMNLRYGAEEVLVQLGDISVNPLIKALGDKDKYVREIAFRALGELGDPRAFDPLIAALKDKDKDVRAAAASALGKLGDTRAFDPLISALGDRDIRESAAFSLGQLGDKRAVSHLIDFLEDQDMRWTAVIALGKLGDTRAVDPLINALGDGKKDVRKSVTEALDKLGWKPDQGEAGALYWFTKGNYKQCLSTGLASVSVLVKALEDADRDVREAVTKTLGQLKDVRAVDPLIAILKESTNSDVRSAAAKSLGQLGDIRAVEPLIMVLSTVGGPAALALGQLGDVRAVEPLIAALESTFYYTRISIMEAFGQLGDPRAVKYLIKALNSTEPSGQYGGDQGGSYRKAAAIALAKIAKKSPKSMLDQWDDIKSKVEESHEDVRKSTTSSDCGVHTDKGIGVPFPAKPKGGDF